MNIEFYAPLKPPTSMVPSGDGRMARTLFSALEYSGHHVHLASEFISREPNGVPAKQEAFRLEGATIARNVINEYEREKKLPDLWFTYHVYYKAPDWIGPLVAKKLNIPYVIAEASHAPKRAGGPWDLSHRHVEKTIKEADLVIGINSIDAGCVRPLLGSSYKYLQLLPFMKLPIFQRPKKRELRKKFSQDLNIDSDQIWFLTVAMMRKGAKLKSYEILSKALRSVKISGWQLLIAGAGPARANVKKLFVGLPVTYVGEEDQSSLFDLMGAADLFLWPAINEAYGMAMLEAQSQGLPVVAGNSGGVGDIVRDGVTGTLTKLGDVTDFSSAIERLMSDPETLAKMSEQARITVECEHSLAGAAHKLTVALEELVDG